MAGDWIKMRMDLPEDPAVFKMAAMTNLDRLSVVGRLYAFWSWADKHAVDGRVDGATSQVVDAVVQLDGFAQVLVAVNWLKIGEDHIEIPRHERHNGESAKERSLKNQRQARWRENKKDVDGKSSTSASTREEKRREEVTTPHSPSSRKRPATPPPDSFEITEQMWGWATGQGVAHERIEVETAKFLDHHKAKGSAFSDWPAAWRKWMRNVVDFAAERRPH